MRPSHCYNQFSKLNIILMFAAGKSSRYSRTNLKEYADARQ